MPFDGNGEFVLLVPLQLGVSIVSPLGAGLVAATASGKSLLDYDYRKGDEQREDCGLESKHSDWCVGLCTLTVLKFNEEPGCAHRQLRAISQSSSIRSRLVRSSTTRGVLT